MRQESLEINKKIGERTYLKEVSTPWENPLFIGFDGKSYTSPDSLRAANQAYDRNRYRLISPITRREYPNDRDGVAAMRADDRTHQRSLLVVV